MISLHGPYSWEILARVIGPEVVGLPYLSLLRLDDGICFRAGKTGEYGYDLLLDNGAARTLLEQIRALADEYDMVEAELPALDQCALENWFFNVRREGSAAVSPLELQLQWRTSRRKQYRGASALAQRRRAGISRRLTTLVAPSAIAAGDAVQLDGRDIGVIANAGHSPARGDHVASAFIDLPYASAGIARYTVTHDGVPVQVRTVSPPVINNRSLHVSPQLHSYATRAEFHFPDLVAHHAAAG
jgi:glycine cleavage system aminomethyltransferase T